MSRSTVTFRSQTVSSIGDLINDEGLVCQESTHLLTSLTGELLRYKNEGIELSPTVLFCTDAGAVLSGFPGSVRHSIGSAPLKTPSVKQVLKDCAPLATRTWNIYIERLDAQIIRYGVFNYITTPTTLPLHEAISLSPEVMCLLLRKTSSSTIEVRGSKGHELALAFSTTREEATQQINPSVPFGTDCCRDLPESSFQEDFETYFGRLIEGGLSRCHGTMLVCATNPVLSEMGDMKDGVAISPKLDFFKAYSEYRSDNTADSILRLQSAEDLFSGILQCDGIIVFDTAGCIVAYRVFYRPTQPEIPGATPPTGGARTRAFEGVKTMVGTVLVSALFRSQDGLTIKEGGA